MGVLDGFLSTWSSANDTFGTGTPQGGAQFDRSADLRQLESTVESANPGGRWTGTASSAYEAANREHGRVFGKLAELDTQLAGHVDQSAAVVTAGRRDLQAVRQWVLDAAASVPNNQAGERMLMPIVQKGIEQVTGIVQKSNGELNEIGEKIRALGGQYQALGNQKFAPKEGEGDAEGIVGDDPGDAKPEDMKDLVDRALKGDQDAAAKVDTMIDEINDGQLQPQRDPTHPETVLPPKPLSPVQAELIHQMQAQMHDKSLSDLTNIKNDLGSHGDIIGDSMQIMSDPDVKYPQPLDPRFEHSLPLPTGTDLNAMPGGKSALPQSVQDVLNADPVHREWNDRGDVWITTYPTKDELGQLSDLISSGDERFQQGSDLDRGMMDRGVHVLDGINQQNADLHIASNAAADPIVQDIFNSAGRDQIVSHDMITAPGSDFIDKVAHHEWADNGASVETLTNWVHDGATSADPDVALRAGETANALSSYLGDPSHDLLNLQHGSNPFYDTKISLGQMNPDLVQGWGHALEPYQKSMMGDGTLPGFDPVPGVANSDYSHMKNIFAVMDSDPTAAKSFNAQAYANILDYQQHPDFNKLANAGGLLGVVDAASLQEMESRGANDLANQTAAYDIKKEALGIALDHSVGKVPEVGGLLQNLTEKGLLGDPPTQQSVDSHAPTKTVADAMNETNYYIADTLVQHDQNLGEMSKYVENGRLMTPDEVSAKHPNDLRNYYLDMKEYVGNRGFDNPMNAFYEEYQNAGGINDPRPPGQR